MTMTSFLFMITAALGGQQEPVTAVAARFTNVTRQSGVAEVVAAHYARSPKWWLSGMDLVDLDGDGDLDLHLAGHGCVGTADHDPEQSQENGDRIPQRIDHTCHSPAEC